MTEQSDQIYASCPGTELVDPAIENGPVDYQSILVPIDFSEHSNKTIQHATRLASISGAAIILLHVCRPPHFVDPHFHGALLQSSELTATEDERGRKLAIVANDLLQKGIDVMALLRSGCPFEEIAAVALEMSVDLIVIGSHGTTGVKHFVLGSTAEKVVQHAPCPVLVVKDRFSIGNCVAQKSRSGLPIARAKDRQ